MEVLRARIDCGREEGQGKMRERKQGVKEERQGDATVDGEAKKGIL